MVKFSREKVLLLHQLIAQETGGEVGLRDQALLDAALAAAFAGMADREFYPSKPEKAAKLGFDLIWRKGIRFITADLLRGGVANTSFPHYWLKD